MPTEGFVYKRPRIRRLRRGARSALNKLLTRFVGTKQPHARPLAGATRRILVVRTNRRLGNILFTTPLLRALHQAFPQASIDILNREPAQAVLLNNLPGIRHVYSQPSGVRRIWRLIRVLRRHHYDLVIDPLINSTSNRVAVVLSGARQRLGFAGPQQWLNLTHAAPPPVSHHQARYALEVLSGGISGVTFQTQPWLMVKHDARARARAEQHLEQALGANATGPIIGFFAHATGAKKLAAGWWREWLSALQDRMQGNGHVLQLYPLGDRHPLVPGLPGIHLDQLDVMAALMARMSVFVVADSGPMHLGAASGVPTIGLFRATDPEHYAPLGPACLTLADAQLTPERVARETMRIINGHAPDIGSRASRVRQPGDSDVCTELVDRPT